MQPLSLLRVAIIHLGSDSPTVVARQVGWVRAAQPAILSNVAPWWNSSGAVTNPWLLTS